MEVLQNEAVPLSPPASPGGSAPTVDGQAPSGHRPLYLVGIDAHLPDRDRPALAVGRVPDGAPRLVFMHNPASFPDLPTGSAPLAIAGHTHGGQIRAPFFPNGPGSA